MLDCRQHAMIAARNHIFSASTMRPIAIACSRNGVASVLKHFSNPWSHQGSDNTCLPPPPLPPLRHRRPESGLASKAANPALLQLPPLAEQQEAGGRPVLSAALRQPLTLRHQKWLQHHTPQLPARWRPEKDSSSSAKARQACAAGSGRCCPASRLPPVLEQQEGGGQEDGEQHD